MVRQEFNYTPRKQFLPYHNRTQRYAVLLCHRRAGKSYATLNDIIVRALTPRPDGLRQQFALMAPTQKQARTIAWQYLKEQTACFEGLGGYKSLEQHLTITLPDPANTNKPGATIMLVGAENAESLRGLFLDGIVIDEAADIPDYVVTQIIRPALADRQGWLTVAGTVKSIDDYLWRTYELAQKVPGAWFSMLLDAEVSGIIPAEELADLKSSMTEEQYQVEFRCNVRAAVTGKILLPYMNMKQITRVPYDPAGSPVIGAWDLGISDSMALWLLQTCGKEPHVINYHQATGKGFDHFVDWMAKLPYAGRIRAQLLPHDSAVRELGNGGKSRMQSLRELGLTGLKKVPKLPKDMQIEAARMFLPMCWFDEDNCSEGLKALRNYSFAFDPKRNVFSLAPKHDQYSNGCLVAGSMVKTTRGLVPIEEVVIGDQVVTPAGVGNVVNAGPTKVADTLITIRTADGKKLTCTPEHKIFTRRGLIEVVNLRVGDIILEGKSPAWRLFKNGAREIFLRLYALATGR